MLSDGEKELLYILGRIYRFRHLENVVLWDTPEAHLNATLESKILAAIGRISARNQTWIATHSLELINSAPLDSIIALDSDGSRVTAERFKQDNKQKRLQIFGALGANIGLQLASKLVVFVEGKAKYSDKSLLDTIYANTLPGVAFIASNDSSTAQQMGYRALASIDEIGSDGHAAVLLDRDYHNDGECEIISRRAEGRIYIWPVHELENVFLDNELIHSISCQLGKQLKTCEIYEKLFQSASEICDWVAADWVAWAYDQQIAPPKRHIAFGKERDDLNAYVSRIRDHLQQLASKDDVDKAFEEKRSECEHLIDSGEFIRLFPGKQLLNHFLGSAGLGVNRQQFLALAASTISRGEVVPAPIDELSAKIVELLK